MSELVLHTATARDLAAFAKRPPHALLIVGPEGSGKLAIAQSLARSVLGLAPNADLAKQSYVRHIVPDGQTISIESIRSLLQFTKLKTASNGIGRIILIEQAHTITSEGQNALLKLLEEPPADTMLILTATSPQELLPTIRSRVQQLAVKQPSQQQLADFFTNEGASPTQIQKTYLMSGGLPGLMHALLHDADHPLIDAAERARALLRATTYERLCQVDALAKQKDECLRMLFILQQMARAALEQAAAKVNQPALRQWQKVLAAAYDAEQAMLGSAQPKLVLTNLMLVL